MDFLPIFLNIRDRPCLIVGAGQVGSRKAALLRRAGAQVTMTTEFREEELGRYALVIAATSNQEVNRSVAAAAKARNIPVNVVDQPALCSFILPSIIERPPLVVAVSSGGASPVLARLLRARLESLIPAAYGRLAALAAQFRERVKARFNGPERRRFWERTLQGRSPSWC
jgi:uroporphyrin-III C-methyltransferase / precorrin-2 dehydrogenase / sirohydrochlorin ferrochelatase